MFKSFAFLFLTTWSVTVATQSAEIESTEAFATAASRCKYPQGSERKFTMKCSSDKIRFATIGDWGVREPDEATLAIAQDLANKASELDFVVSAGDNFYQWGVKSVNDKQWDNTWFDRYKVDQLNLLWIALLGNHDYYGNPRAQIDYTTARLRGSKYWFMPNNYFTLEINANGKRFSFVTLDTNVLPDDKNQLNWLDSQLSQTLNSPRVVLGHHHIFSAGYRGDNQDLQSLAKRFSSVGMKNYICGHEHDMQLVSHDNTNYFVIGGSGARLRHKDNLWTKLRVRNPKRNANVKFYQLKHGYSRHEIDLSTNRMTTWIETFEDNGDHADTSVFYTDL